MNNSTVTKVVSPSRSNTLTPNKSTGLSQTGAHASLGGFLLSAPPAWGATASQVQYSPNSADSSGTHGASAGRGVISFRTQQLPTQSWAPGAEPTLPSGKRDSHKTHTQDIQVPTRPHEPDGAEFRLRPCRIPKVKRNNKGNRQLEVNYIWL